MKHKTSELSGALLDVAVATALGWRKNEYLQQWEYLIDGDWHRVAGTHLGGWSPSTLWNDGGPIIDRERIGIEWDRYNCFGMGWVSVLEHDARPDGVQRSFGRGDTPLIAAMRAFCCAKLGDEVEL